MIHSLSVCINCGDIIKSGRSDKKFCDSGCKDEYYNRIKINEHKEIKKIDQVLKKNRRILKKIFNPKKEKLVSRDMLLKQGFEFGFHTHVVITATKSNEIIFCYDYGYREVSKDKFQLYPSYSTVRIKDGDVFKL